MSLMKNILTQFNRLSQLEKQAIENAFGEISQNTLKNFKHSQKEFLFTIINWILHRKAALSRG